GSIVVGPNKTFFVNLSNPINGVLGRGQAAGTIINNNGLPGQLYRLSWSAISSPQLVNAPFGVTISALDYFNGPATNFNGTVNLSSTVGGGAVTNVILGNIAPTTSSSGNYTLGYRFTPNTNLTVTHVRSYFGTKVSI